MTAYNEINGVPCMVMRDIKDYAKDRWGLHHVVTDGGDVLQTVNQHEYFGTDAQTVAAGIKQVLIVFLITGKRWRSSKRSICPRSD